MPVAIKSELFSVYADTSSYVNPRYIMVHILGTSTVPEYLETVLFLTVNYLKLSHHKVNIIESAV